MKRKLASIALVALTLSGITLSGIASADDACLERNRAKATAENMLNRKGFLKDQRYKVESDRNGRENYVDTTYTKAVSTRGLEVQIRAQDSEHSGDIVLREGDSTFEVVSESGALPAYSCVYQVAGVGTARTITPKKLKVAKATKGLRLRRHLRAQAGGLPEFVSSAQLELTFDVTRDNPFIRSAKCTTFDTETALGVFKFPEVVRGSDARMSATLQPNLFAAEVEAYAQERCRPVVGYSPSDVRRIQEIGTTDWRADQRSYTRSSKPIGPEATASGTTVEAAGASVGQ